MDPVTALVGDWLIRHLTNDADRKAWDRLKSLVKPDELELLVERATDRALRDAVGDATTWDLTPEEQDAIVDVLGMLWPKETIEAATSPTLLGRLEGLVRAAISAARELVDVDDDYAPMSSYEVLQRDYGLHIDPDRFAERFQISWTLEVLDRSWRQAVAHPLAAQLYFELNQRSFGRLEHQLEVVALRVEAISAGLSGHQPFLQAPIAAMPAALESSRTAFLTRVPGRWGSRVPRPQDVASLRQLLLEHHPPIVLLAGLSGSGKTDVIMQYIDDHARRYRSVCWIDCRSEESIRTSLAVASECLVGKCDSNEQAYRDLSRYWAERGGPHLLVVDGADELEAVRDLLPRLDDIHVIVTARRREGRPGLSEHVLDDLPILEAAAWLAATVGSGDHGDAESALRIMERTPRLPLVVSVVAGQCLAPGGPRLSEVEHSLDDFLHRSLRDSDPDSGLTPENVVMWALDRVEGVEPGAHLLLHGLCRAAPAPFPTDVFSGSGFGGRIDEPRSAVDISRAQFEVAARYFLIDLGGGYARMADVVRVVLRSTVPPFGDAAVNAVAFALQAEASAQDRSAPWYASIASHATELARTASDSHARSAAREALSAAAGGLLNRGWAEYSLAVLEVLIDVADEDSAQDVVLTALNLRSNVYQQLEDHEAAIKSVTELVSLSGGSIDPDLEARVLNNAGRSLCEVGKWWSGRMALRMSLGIKETLHGEHSAELCQTLLNLGQELARTESTVDEALDHLRRARTIADQQYVADPIQRAKYSAELGARLVQHTDDGRSEGIRLLRQAADLVHPVAADNPTVAVNTHAQLGQALELVGVDPSRPLGEAVRIARRSLPLEHPLRLRVEADFAQFA